jgi:hypothetical protein
MGLNAVARARDFGDLAHSMSHLAAALAGAATLSDRDSMTVRS